MHSFERIALFSDVHGNSPALAAVLDDIQSKQCTQAYFLGDLINGLDPAGCVQSLREWTSQGGIPLVCLKGNAEHYLLTPQEGLPKHDGMSHETLLKLTSWWRERLTLDELEWITTWPDYLHRGEMLLVHDSPAERLFPESWHRPELKREYQEWFYHARGLHPEMPEVEWDVLRGLMENLQVRHVFCGHTHVPFLRQESGYSICNLGSAGMPLDGDPRPSWASLEIRPEQPAQIQLHRLAYDPAPFESLINANASFFSFQQPGFTSTYRQMFVQARHWSKITR